MKIMLIALGTLFTMAALGADANSHSVVVTTSGNHSSGGIQKASPNQTQRIVTRTRTLGLGVEADTAATLDEIRQQIDAAIQQALEKASDKEALKQALEKARDEIESALSQRPPQNQALDSSRKRSGHSATGGTSSGGGTGGRGSSSHRRVVTRTKQGLNPSGEVLPAIVTTRRLDAGTMDHWHEDLRIMDKLLRNVIAGGEGDSSPRAMGLNLLFAKKPESQPMYLEDFGAVFPYTTSIALAGSTNNAASDTDRNTSSAWENARRELNTSINRDNVRVWIQTYTSEILNPQHAPPYDAQAVEKLVDDLLETLPEAKNIRHLAANECVVVTLGGSDDQGNPRRLTLKARKKDIDALANGAINLEAFKKKIARTIN